MCLLFIVRHVLSAAIVILVLSKSVLHACLHDVLEVTYIVEVCLLFN